MQRPGKDQTKTAEKTEWQRTEIQSSEFRGNRVHDSKQYSNNTKTVGAVTDRRVAVAATRRATIGRAVVVPITAAEHAAGAGGWALWVVSTG